MSVEQTPRGTRGAGMPRLPGPVMWLFTALNVAMFRLLGTRMRVAGLRLLLLITVGSKSGRLRRTTIGWMPDPAGGWIVVASNAGSARHPGWFMNLARNPDQVWVEIDGQTHKAHAESLRGAEREEAWRRLVAQAPRYAKYQTMTDRRIPLVRLLPVAGTVSTAKA